MSSNIDQDFVEYIVKSLVGQPDKVIIERRIDEKGVLLELTVDPEDLGRIIGKRGATAQSLRTLLRALGTKNDARYNLKIVDNGPEDYQRPARDDKPAQAQTSQSDDTQSDEEVATQAPKPAPAPKEQAKRPTKDRSRMSYKERAEDKLLGTIEEHGEEPEEVASEEDTSSERARRTRQELEDLDDLDI